MEPTKEETFKKGCRVASRRGVFVNRVDGIILGIGAIVLIASIMGVIFYEDDTETQHTITWGAGEAEELDAITDSVEAGSSDYSVDIEGGIIRSVTFTVEVTSDGSTLTGDDVTITAEGPQGQSGDCSFTIPALESEGSCDAEADVNPEPEVATVQAGTTAEARERAIEEASSEEGNGTWTLTVDIDEGNEVGAPSYEISIVPAVVEWAPEAQGPSINPPR